MDKPLVSVIMPAYNAESYIEAAIVSVQIQTVKNWELLVMDDGSSDHTCAVVEKLAAKDGRVRLMKNPQNMGVAKTRNRALDLAKGAYVAFLDSDDMWVPQKLEKQIARMQEEKADISYCSYALVDWAGNKTRSDYIVPAKIDYKGLLKENVMGCSSVMLSRRVAEKYRFNTDFYHEDYVLWLELLRDGFTAAGCREVLVNWRFIPDSRSFNKRKSAKNRWRIYRHYLKLPLHKCVWLLGNYAIAGLRKYLRKH